MLKIKLYLLTSLLKYYERIHISAMIASVFKNLLLQISINEYIIHYLNKSGKVPQEL